MQNTSGRTHDRKTVSLRFNGSGGQLFVNMLVGYVLTIITLGIYFPWFYCSLIKWFTENTQADIEGLSEAAGVFKNTADGETGHAFGHLEFLEKGGAGDPATGLNIGETEDNLKAAVAGETYEYTEMYPGFAATAREEGFDDIAEWFETLARAEKSHAGKFQETLDSL